MAKQSWVAAVVLLVLAGLVAGGYYVMAKREADYCGFCHRMLHPNTKVVAEVGGRRRTVCCVRCAINEALQEKKALRLISVTDFTTGKEIDPKQAFFVEGSHRVLCTHDGAMVDESKHAQPMTYDRCFPGTYAFARQEDAEAFERENGGTVLPLSRLLQGVNGQ
jgi:nitrous oxide reductase accessory protein NosL